MRWLLAVVLAPLLLGLAEALQRGFLYPHGRGVPDKILPPQDDVSSPELFLRTPIVFYGEVYNSIYVSNESFIWLSRWQLFTDLRKSMLPIENLPNLHR